MALPKFLKNGTLFYVILVIIVPMFIRLLRDEYFIRQPAIDKRGSNGRDSYARIKRIIHVENGDPVFASEYYFS